MTAGCHVENRRKSKKEGQGARTAFFQQTNIQPVGKEAAQQKIPTLIRQQLWGTCITFHIPPYLFVGVHVTSSQFN